ncbi:MAG: sugar phosphate isomerase/epimerase [Acidobacteria bacterium]|nr:sugar phosphate isomerase/epimerase [Acidobacteriota bacterium]
MLSRRDFTRLAGAALPAASLLAKPNSNFRGVQIGAITYSFRALPSGAEEVLKYCLDCGISAIELMSNVPESFAGSPAPRGMGFGPGGPGQKGARPPPEQIEARKKSQAAVVDWRLSVSMDKFKAFRTMYEQAGIRIYAFKLPPTMDMSDAEYAYIWNVAEALGANHITMELPTDPKLLARVAAYAAQRKLAIAFHTHGQGGESGFESALSASPYTALNLDVGHFYGVNGVSPVPVIEKYHQRIASLHLKDRKGPNSEGAPPGRGGANMPWGQGETPLKEILQTMRRNKYKFPASIEYEYETPAGSDVLAEMKKCVQYCKDALA